VYLLDRKADPNLSNARGWNPLYQTVKNRNLETGAVPLMKVGVLTDELELMKIILAHGADPNIRMKANSQSRNGQGGTWMDENGATPFLRASMNGDVEVMKILLRAGADPNLESVDGTTPLMALAGVGYAEGFISHHSEKETMEAFHLLLDMGADINARKKSGRFKGMTALHGAAHRGDNFVLKALVDLGAPIDVVDDTRQSEGAKIAGLTPLDWAIGVRISVASPVYKDSTVELLKQMYADRGMPLPANALGTVGGKRSAAGTGIKEEQKLEQK
jgi:ankyrin repeat protein